MGKTNLDKVRATKEEVAKGSSKSNNYKWKEGMNRLRIAPPPDGSDEPWRKVIVSFDVGPGKRVAVGPRQYGLKDDPLADHIDSLNRRKDKASKDEFKRIKPSTRYKVLALDRDNEAAGIQIADFNVIAIDDVLKFFSDPEYGDLSDPVDGRDLKITYTPKAKSKSGFPVFDVVPAAKQTPLRPKDWSDEDYAALLEVDFFEEFRVGFPHTPAYLKAILEGKHENFQGPRMMRPDGSSLKAAEEPEADEGDDEDAPAPPVEDDPPAEAPDVAPPDDQAAVDEQIAKAAAAKAAGKSGKSQAELLREKLKGK